MKHIYLSLIIANCLLVSLNVAPIAPQACNKAKVAVSSPVTLARFYQQKQLRQMFEAHKWNAIFKADSLGITPEEYLASLNGVTSREDEECEFFTNLYNE